MMNTLSPAHGYIIKPWEGVDKHQIEHISMKRLDDLRTLGETFNHS